MIPALRLDEEFSVGTGEEADKQVQTLSTHFAEGKNENKDRLLKKRQVFLFKTNLYRLTHETYVKYRHLASLFDLTYA